MNRNFPDSSPGLLLVDSEITASLSRCSTTPSGFPRSGPTHQACTVLDNSIIDHEAMRREFRQAVVLHGRVALGDDLLPTVTSWPTSPDMAAASHKRNTRDRAPAEIMSRVWWAVALAVPRERRIGPGRRSGSARALPQNL